MFEKVNPCHPDKVADRVAGALVDLAYAKSHDPKIAVEVLIGHGQANVIVETSEDITADECHDAVVRIAGPMPTYSKVVRQDPHLAQNQADGFRCGDNGIFKGTPVTREQQVLTSLAHTIYLAFPTDGKYVIDATDVERIEHEGIITKEKWATYKMGSLNKLTICQSHARRDDIEKLIEAWDEQNDHILSSQGRLWRWPYMDINPLGDWTGGPDVDTGATNCKLGSDMGDSVTGGGLMGKDLSKADVSVNIVCHLKAVASGQVVTAICSIGDESVTFTYADGRTETERFADIVEQARLYILTDCGGSFEKFAEWGLIRAKED